MIVIKSKGPKLAVWSLGKIMPYGFRLVIGRTPALSANRRGWLKIGVINYMTSMSTRVKFSKIKIFS